mgnify:CR=1 FL=1
MPVYDLPIHKIEAILEEKIRQHKQICEGQPAFFIDERESFLREEIFNLNIILGLKKGQQK